MGEFSIWGGGARRVPSNGHPISPPLLFSASLPIGYFKTWRISNLNHRCGLGFVLCWERRDGWTKTRRRRADLSFPFSECLLLLLPQRLLSLLLLLLLKRTTSWQVQLSRNRNKRTQRLLLLPCLLQLQPRPRQPRILRRGESPSFSLHNRARSLPSLTLPYRRKRAVGGLDDKKRAKRLFGGLLGTLDAFKVSCRLLPFLRLVSFFPFSLCFRNRVYSLFSLHSPFLRSDRKRNDNEVPPML